MPVTPTYPGVYIEEIPSGVRTITGVATSITAFLGRALRGPVSEPTSINNFGDFERQFGGLQVEYPMTYAVRDFYQNGGAQALIVRLYADPKANKAKDAAEEVAKAVKDAAEAAGATSDSVQTAANTKAAEFTEEPKKSAAQVVATAVQTAIAGETEDDAAKIDAAKTAAEKASQDVLKNISIPSPNAKLILPTGENAKEAVESVVKAVNDAASAAGATPTTVQDAANNKAAEFTAEPAKAEAKKVADAVQVAIAGETGNDAAKINAAKAAAQETAQKTADAANLKLILVASSPGTWGNNLEVIVNYDDINDDVAERYNLESEDLFNLIVREKNGRSEKITNLSFKESTRRLDRILAKESDLIRYPVPESGEPNFPNFRPNKTQKKPDGEPIPIVVEKNDKSKESDPLKNRDYTGSEAEKTGLFALEKADLFNLLCIPPDQRGPDGGTEQGVYDAALKYCVKRRAMLIVDPPAAWGKNKETAAEKAKEGLAGLKLTGPNARNAALYFPRVIQQDPLREGQLDIFVPCGIIAGIMARTDVQRGVWKAPAGIDAAISGILGLQVNLTDDENGLLNPIGINCLRYFPPVYGNVVWGARTLRGADQLADEYKYVPVRRFVLFLEESLYRGTKWVVFEPNDEPLWAQIRLNIGVFMNDLFRQGAFQGKSPKDAYFVKCDSETTTQSDINRGIVNIIVGFAPLKPAEFVIIKFQQMAGQLAT